MNKFLFFIFLLPLSARSFTCAESDLQLKYANQLESHQQFLLASVQYSLVSLAENCDVKYEARLGYARAMFALAENDEVVRTLTPLKDSSAPISVKKRATYILGFIDSSLLSDSDNETREKFLLWKNREHVEKKSAVLAGSLSAILPGTGQIYNGNYQSAALSFVLNALFLAATIELQQKGLYATSIAAGAVFSITYVGNIVSAAKGAEQININWNSARDVQLRKTLFEF